MTVAYLIRHLEAWSDRSSTHDTKMIMIGESTLIGGRIVLYSLFSSPYAVRGRGNISLLVSQRTHNWHILK